MKRGYVVLVLATSLGLVVAACGGGGEPSKPSGTQSPADRGRQLANAQGCLGCHSTDGSALVGPTWKSMYGHEVKLANGQTATADDAYITESIYEPDSKVVQGFPSGTMPSFKGTLSSQDVQAIIEYIKTLR